MPEHPLDTLLAEQGANFVDVRSIRVAEDYGDVAAEYTAASSGAAIFDARERGLIQVSGADRAAWLHNLTTNAVRDLAPGEGNYAFVTNAKGRILFDVNVIVLGDALWLDVDRRLVPRAMAHLDRYLITEDVRLEDRGDTFTRIALLGPKATQIAEALGATHAVAMASLGSTSVPLVQKQRLMVRHDFAGVFAVELYIEAGDAAACWQRLVEIGMPVNLRPVGRSAVHSLRVEAGVPLYGEDIDEDVLPAETGQIERAISYVKGCYLGQEVVERMHSRGSLARRLVGLRFSGGASVEPGTELVAGEATVGRVTSSCYSYALSTRIGLGYVKTSHVSPGTQLQTATTPPISAEADALPFRGPGWQQ